MSLTSYRAAPPRDGSFEAPGDVIEIVKGSFGCWGCGAGFNAWRRPTLPLLRQ